MGANFYPSDLQVRDWSLVAFVVTEATWKHIDEYKESFVGSAREEVARRTGAITRGLQQASFQVVDQLDNEEMDVDDVLNVVSIFYLAAMEVARFLREQKTSRHTSPALTSTAENLLKAAVEWSEAYSKGFALAKKGEE